MQRLQTLSCMYMSLISKAHRCSTLWHENLQIYFSWSFSVNVLLMQKKLHKWTNACCWMTPKQQLASCSPYREKSRPCRQKLLKLMSTNPKSSCWMHKFLNSSTKILHWSNRSPMEIPTMMSKSLLIKLLPLRQKWMQWFGKIIT